MATIVGGFLGLVLLCGLLAFGMWGCPTYKVWQQGMEGKAALQRAEQDRQIKVQEAVALRDAAMYRAAADSIRAEGTANANRIINASLTSEYIKWYFVEGLNQTAESGNLQIIYIPTEANVPITEAARLQDLPLPLGR